MDIFEMPDGRDLPGGFKFVIPHTAVSADDVRIDFDRETKQWVLTYDDAGQTWTGRADDLTRAYLDLIADRLGVSDRRAADTTEAT